MGSLSFFRSLDIWVSCLLSNHTPTYSHLWKLPKSASPDDDRGGNTVPAWSRGTAGRVGRESPFAGSLLGLGGSVRGAGWAHHLGFCFPWDVVASISGSTLLLLVKVKNQSHWWKLCSLH